MNIRKWIWLLLGIISVIIPKIIPTSIIEQYYSRGIYLAIRKLFDSISNVSPIPIITILIILLVFSFIFWIRKHIKTEGSIFKLFRESLNFIGAMVFFFQFLWGLNYGRVPFEENVGLDSASLNINDLKDEFNKSSESLINSNKAWNRIEIPNYSIYPDNGEGEIRENVKAVLNQFQYPAEAKVRARVIQPKGILMRNNATGIFMPYSGEGHIDKGLNELKIPFVMAHEMSHGYGFGDEGICNFLAYLACIQSDNSYLNYVGHLTYWRYVARDMIKNGLVTPEDLETRLPEEIQLDLKAIRDDSKKYPDLFPKFGDATYNTYLKAQGVEGGIESYNQIVRLAREWRNQNGLN